MARYINTTQGINKVNILIDDPVSNTGNTFTVTPIRTWESEKKEITTNELINGLSSSTDRTEISGRLLIGSSRPVATIQIDTISDYYISSEPTISTNFNNNLDFQLRSITKNDDGYITSYVFELFCFIESSIVGSNNLKCTINYVTKVIPTVSSLITNISFGNNIINSQGETRTINIHGTSGSTFGIAVNENFEELISLDEETVSHFDKVNDTSILNKNLSNDTAIHDYAKEINVISGTIDRTGIFSFEQKFPNNVAVRTKATSALSGSATLDVTSTTGVRVGDRVRIKGISKSTIVLVQEVVTATRITLDTTITIADNAGVVFTRKRVYSIDVIPDLTSTLGSNISTTNPHYRLFQYKDPQLTIRNSTAATTFAITHNNSVATGLSAGAELDLKYIGKPNAIGSNISQLNHVTSKFTVSMLIDLVDGAKTFTAVSKPVFNKLNSTLSSWTNTVPEENGGTDVRIYGITSSATGANTITLSYNVEIKKWGVKDVIMDLNLDNILTHS